MKQYGLSAVALILTGSLFVACAGGGARVQSAANRAPLSRTLFGKVGVLPSGAIAHVNDAPRNAKSARFAERRAEAHARGLWLTDELNRPSHLTRITTPTASPIAGQTLLASSQTRSMSYEKPGCNDDSCDGGGAGDPGDPGPGEYYFSDPAPYDVEADYPDGTSVLFEEFNDTEGNDILTTLEADGSYLAWYVNSTTPVPRPTMGSKICMIDMDGFTYMVPSGSSCQSTIPKAFCPLAAGVVGLAARWAAIAISKNPEIANATTVLVAGTYAAGCNSQ